MTDEAGGFGRLLRAYRREAGLSQDELAERSALSTHAISSLERGRTTSPHRDSVHRLADALDLREQAREEFLAAAGRRLAPETIGSGQAAAGKHDGPFPRGDGHVVPRQLPAAIPAFVGRDEQLAVLSQVLCEAGGTAVVTAIGGIAGVGKTALAVHWAHQAAEQFPDGQLFVNLRGFDPAGGSPLTAAEAVRGFLDALEVPANRIPVALQPQFGLYRSLLSGKRILIVLDNAADADQVRPLLPGSPTCRTIVTTRNQLPGLTAIDAAHPLQLDVLSTAEAHDMLTRRLGVDRITAEPDAVAQIVSGCGRLPLALAITAARAAGQAQLPLAAIAAKLTDATHRLDALHTASDPLASVRAVFDCSYRHLDRGAARVFRLLGLYPGPDIGLAAAASLTALDLEHTRHALDALTTAGLVTEHNPGRYSFHDLLRAYAADQANSHDSEPDRRDALRRVCDFYVYTAHCADRLLAPHRPPIELDPPAPGTHSHPLTDASAALAWFDAEHANLLAAARTAGACAWHLTVWQLAWTLDHFHYRRGHLREALTVWQAALEAAAHLPDPATRTLAHRLLGHAYTYLGQHQEAIEHLNQALASAERRGDSAGRAHTHSSLAIAWARQSDDCQALKHATRALELYRTLDQPLGEARALNAVGWYAARLGDYDTARARCHAALALYQLHLNPDGEADTLDSLGFIDYQTGDHQRAIDHYQRALALFRSRSHTYQVADTLVRVGHPYAALGQYEHTRTVWHQAIDMYREQERTEEVERIQRELNALDRSDTE